MNKILINDKTDMPISLVPTPNEDNSRLLTLTIYEDNKSDNLNSVAVFEFTSIEHYIQFVEVLVDLAAKSTGEGEGEDGNDTENNNT